MSLKDKIDQDLKTALLGGDKTSVDTLRGLKSVILYDEVAKGKKDSGISDPEIISLLQKEAKKRQESADLYKSGGNSTRSDQELLEKSIIEGYLPKSLTEDETSAIIDKVLSETENPELSKMGQIIASAKALSGGSADGATLARIVREKLSK